jgi:F-type H+-transporting ATPase subunit epsilon
MSVTDHISLVILTPEKMLLEKQVSSVSMPGTKGRFMVLKDHAPLISSLEEGEVCYDSSEGGDSLYVRSGFVEVIRNKVTVCAEL